MNLGLEGLEIVGSESHGDYRERLDPATGGTIAHRVFRLGPPGFQPPSAAPQDDSQSRRIWSQGNGNTLIFERAPGAASAGRRWGN